MKTYELKLDIDTVLKKVENKVLWQIKNLDGAIPYIPVDGSYIDKGQEDISWWTNGFWGGLLWNLYSVSGNEEVLNAAINVEERLDKAFVDFNDLHHDVGFLWHLTSVANYKLTDNSQSKTRGLHAANILAGRYNIAGEFLRCWNDDATGWVIIDSLMNLPLLYWASEVSLDPRFKMIAMSHVETVLEHMIRPDGSSCHIGIFDPLTGAFLEESGGQGFSASSSWTRGQSWALYGLTLTYIHTKEAKYLEDAKRIANYYVTNISSHGYVPPVDFRGAVEDKRTDTSSAMSAACGLLELAHYVDKADAKIYYETALKILDVTTEKFADFDLVHDGIIGGGTVAYHREVENEVPIVYSDFFYVEALLKLKKAEFKIW